MDLAIVLDHHSFTPLFAQLSQALKERIVSGSLAAGKVLPSSRELADSLGISRGTALKAYNDLIAQGYLEGITGSGTFVSRRAESEAEHAAILAAPPKSAHLPGNLSEEAAKLMRLNYSSAHSGSLPQLNYGAPPLDLVPVAAWKETLLNQTRLLQLHHYGTAPETLGHYKLRQEIAAFLGRAKALNCRPEQIIVFPGSQQALTYIARMLLDPGDTVIVENPGYGAARDHFLLREADLMALDVDHDGLKTEALEAVRQPVKLVYVTPHHDPTGAILSLSRRKALLAWAGRAGATIVEDAWDSDYVYVQPPVPSLQGLDQEGRVIYLYSFWKLLFPLLTIGCAVVPPALVPIFDRVKFMTERYFPVLEHIALAQFISEGKLERYIKRTRSIYEKRRKALTEALRSTFKTQIEIAPQSAGLHLCVRFAPHLLDKGLEQAAAQAGLTLVGTAQYYVSSAPGNEFLIPFAATSEQSLSSAVELLGSRLL